MGRYDTIQEVRKHDSEARTLEEVLKFNPYHGYHGHFASADSATSMTVFTNSPAGQKAIANIKAKQQAVMGSSSESGIAGSTKPKKQPKSTEPPQDIGNTKKQKKHKDPEAYGYLSDSIPSDKAYEQVAKDIRCSKEEAKTMVDSIWGYSDGNYDYIREASRGEASSYGNEANACENFIYASPKWAGGQLQRGLKISDESGDYEKIMKNVQAGKPIDMGGISSWSSDPEIAHNFTGGDHPVILVTNGKSTNHGTSISHLSEYGPSKSGSKGEKEVLMSSTAIFTPTSMEMINGTTYIYGDMP